MKCIVLSNSQYIRKKDGQPGWIANVVYLRNGSVNVQQAFGMADVNTGDVIDIVTDLRGYMISHTVIDSSSAVDALIGELQHL